MINFAAQIQNNNTAVSTSVCPSFHHIIHAHCLHTIQSAGFRLLGFPPEPLPRVVTNRDAQSSERTSLLTLNLR